MHEGHRKRMYEKLKNNAYLHDHELLEMLLFNAYPRVNTNPIAHGLLNAFGSIQGVFDAEIEDLVKVDGVGESAACYLKCIGECIRIKENSEKDAVTLKSYDDFRSFATFRLRRMTEEVLEFYCMEKSGKVIKIFSFTSQSQSSVRVEAEKVSEIISTVKPYGILVAHNHLSGNATPSENDNLFTMKVQLICSMNNVNLMDHCIYSGGEVYSYFLSGRIDEIKRKYSYDKLVSEQYIKDKMADSDKK